MPLPSLVPIRGTLDLLPRELARRSRVANAFADVAEAYGFMQAETPLLESASVFERSLGDCSDVVAKEMFHVARQANEDGSVVLRPEGTAGMMRALFAKGVLPYGGPHLLYYCGPQFRYERPQKGRLRQFTQFGLECVNRASMASVDAEIITMAYFALAQAGVQNSKLEINSLGCPASRQAYQRVLDDHLKRFKLSADSQNRLQQGRSLRVLDSKDPVDLEAIASAPLLSEHLTKASSARFADVLSELGRSGVQYEINPRLVRGLDYYNDTCFEFTCEPGLGSKSTLVAGGRYDLLAQAIGGHHGPISSIGWAAGLERILLALEALEGKSSKDQAENRIIPNMALVVPVVKGVTDVNDLRLKAEYVCASARDQGLKATLCLEALEPNTSFNLKKALQLAEKLSCGLTLFVGPEEAPGTVSYKRMEGGEKGVVNIASLRDLMYFEYGNM